MYRLFIHFMRNLGTRVEKMIAGYKFDEFWKLKFYERHSYHGVYSRILYDESFARVKTTRHGGRLEMLPE